MMKQLLPISFLMWMHLLAIPFLWSQTAPHAGLEKEAPTYQQSPYKLIAHRGGIVEGRYAENTERAIQAAVDRGYWMLEVDIRESKDGKLIVHHDEDFQRFYGDPRKVADMNWEEISQLKTEKGTSPIQFETLAELCQGKIRLMMDTKGPSHSQEFYEEMERVLKTYQLLESAYFIGTQESQDYFQDLARTSINREELKAAIEAGEAVSKKYFLFEHGNELDEETVTFAQSHDVPVVPSVNLFHYLPENQMTEAYLNITDLKALGVTEFQIDSEYDRWLLYPERKGYLTLGPVIGHLTSNTANIWARMSQPGYYRLYYWTEGGDTLYIDRTTTIEDDFTATWSLSKLSPNTTYHYILRDKPSGRFTETSTFTTPLPHEEIEEVAMAFGSCFHDIPLEPAPVWDAIRQENPDVLILMGDTPYIDATSSAYQERRYKELYAVPEFQRLLSQVSFYSIWDDHDFGKNDTDGNLAGKEYAREAFMQYRPNPTYGFEDQGLYTHFRRGPVEVFLLDTRWFAGTEPSPFDSDQPSLLGKKQWEWLQKGLTASTAPFKLLVSSMIWNGAVRPNKPDHWDSYSHEKEALFQFIGEKEISGIVLLGGDIHRSRLLTYDTEATAGYAISEFITSPLHDGVSEAANAPHPQLIHDAGVPHTFLMMNAKRGTDDPSIAFRCMTAEGEIPFEASFTLSELSAQTETSRR